MLQYAAWFYWPHQKTHTLNGLPRSLNTKRRMSKDYAMCCGWGWIWNATTERWLPHRISMDAHDQKIAQSFGVAKQSNVCTVEHIPSAVDVHDLLSTIPQFWSSQIVAHSKSLAIRMNQEMLAEQKHTCATFNKPLPLSRSFRSIRGQLG